MESATYAFGAAGDADALVTEFLAAGDSAPVTHVIDASSGEIIDRLPGTSALLPTDDPGAPWRTSPTTAPSVGTTRRRELGLDAASNSITISPSSPLTAIVVLVGEFDDEVDGHLIQGVDLDDGQLVPPTIDGRGQFWSSVALGPDAIYTAIEAFDDPVSAVSGETPTPARCSRRYPASRTSPSAAGPSLPAPRTDASTSSTRVP